MSRELSARYCGLELRSPIVVGASPLALNNERVRQFTLAGAGAVVLPSLFEEQVLARLDCYGYTPSQSEEELDLGTPLRSEDFYNRGIDDYFRTISRLKRQVGIPIFANLHGCTTGAWLRVGSDLQAAGADGIEVNFDATYSGPNESADESEKLLLAMVTELCDQVTIPVAVKVSPFHSNFSNLAWRLSESGAAGIVCFGFEPNWEVSESTYGPTPMWNLNSPGNLNQTIAGLARTSIAQAPLSLAASGGINSAEDAVKALLAGADICMVTSEIYRYGPDAIAHIVEGLSHYLGRSVYDNLESLLQCRPTPNVSRQSLLSSLTRSRR